MRVGLRSGRLDCGSYEHQAWQSGLVFNFLCLSDVWVNGFEIVVDMLYEVIVYSKYCGIFFTTTFLYFSLPQLMLLSLVGKWFVVFASPAQEGEIEI